MKSVCFLLPALALMLGTAIPRASAQIEGPPNRVDYQGHVLDSAGAPLASDAPVNYTMQFRLYNAQTGGTLLWSESQTVTVSKGAFSVRLGEGVAIPADNIQASVQQAGLVNVFSQKDRFLGLTVQVPGQTPAEITPRLAFLSSPFSFNANKARESDSLTMLDAANNRLGTAKLSDFFTVPAPTTGTPQQIADAKANPVNWKIKEQQVPVSMAIPVGGVIMWWGASGAIPAGFEICDGNNPASGSTLAVRKPDLRDKFVKGAGTGATNVAATPVTGGTHTTSGLSTNGTALTQAQLPPITVSPTELTALGAGAHFHSVYEGNNEGGDNDGGDGGGAATGDSFDRNIPTTWTSTSGHHTHQVSGTINAAGSGQTHTHTIPNHDNRPAFVELFYIIRVK